MATLYGLYRYGTVQYSAPLFVQWIVPVKDTTLWTSMKTTVARFPVTYGVYLYSRGPSTEPTLYSTVPPDNQWTTGTTTPTVWTKPEHI